MSESPQPERAFVAAPDADHATSSTRAQTGLDVPACLALCCPHCHSPLRMDNTSFAVILCPECGGSFRVENVAPASTTEDIRVVGRFHLLDAVGHGSFGVVWRARDTALGRIVALKVPHPSLRNSPAHLERFQREARAAAQLRHPGIARLYEVITIEGTPLLVSDFIDGPPLKDVIETTRLTFREAAALVAEVAEALHYSHTRGLVHRDIKPSNILLERSGQAAEVRAIGKPIIVDFGLALREEMEIVMTVEGQIIGTPAYMSPEQAAGQGHRVDGRSDVYSLGVVLYQLLCGELPFRGSKAMLVHQVRHEEPRPPRRVNDKIPRDLETICLKAMAKQPFWRYATAADLAADLRFFLEGKPIQARPVRRPERLWRWCRRNRGVAVASAVALAALLAFLVMTTIFAIHQARSLDESRRFAATLAFDRALAICEKGDVALGMLWLARSLEVAPEGAADFQRVIRTNLAGWRNRLCAVRGLLPHEDLITATAFSPDGTTVLTASRDKTARLWDVATGLPLGEPMMHPDAVLTAAFSPDGKTVVTASADKLVRLWNTGTFKLETAPLSHQDLVFAVGFNPDGKTLVTGGHDQTARLWNAADGQPKNIVLPHDSSVRTVAFSPDGKTILTGGKGGKLRLWDAATGGLRRVFPTDSPLEAAAFSPDGKTIISAGVKVAHVWDAATQKVRHRLPHEGVVQAIAFSADSKIILTGSQDKSFRLWDAASGKLIGGPVPCLHAVRAVSLSPHGRRLVIGSGNVACLRDSFPRAWPHATLLHDHPVWSAALSPDGKTILTGTRDYPKKKGETLLWDIAGERPITRATSAGFVMAVAFSPDGSMALSGSADGIATVIDSETGRPVCAPLRHGAWIYALAFGPDGKHVATAGGDGNVRLWDVASAKSVGAPLAHQGTVRSVAFFPDGQRLCTAGEDKTARIWDIHSGKLLQTLHHRDTVWTLAVGPSGRAILTGSFDRTARLWDALTGAPLTEPLAHRDKVLTVAFSPSGRIGLSGSEDGTGRIWDLLRGEPLCSPLVHQAKVEAVAFHPEGTAVLTASQDGTAQLWDTETGKPLGPPLTHDKAVHCVAFSRDGNSIVTASEDRTARLWQMPGLADGNPQAILLWVQTLTGMELDRTDAIRILSAAAWQQRSKELQRLDVGRAGKITVAPP